MASKNTKQTPDTRRRVHQLARSARKSAAASITVSGGTLLLMGIFLALYLFLAEQPHIGVVILIGLMCTLAAAIVIYNVVLLRKLSNIPSPTNET